MRDGFAASQFLLRAVLIDVNRLLVTGCFRKFVDAILISIHSLAPISVPMADLISSNPLNIRMVGHSG